MGAHPCVFIIVFSQVKSLAPETPGIGSLLQEAKVALAKSKRIDYYKVLGVASTASQDEIKKAYKKTALKLRKPSIQMKLCLPVLLLWSYKNITALLHD